MFNLFGGPSGATFEAHYRALPVAFIDKPSADDGDKIFLPPSALDRLASLHIEYPMLFKVENVTTGRFTHCGVLEFIADEGVVYMPHWMMQNLLLEVGNVIKLRSASLPKGTYVKLQPVTSDFLDISNPKAVLERTLRSYSCLTVGDCFVVNYNNKKYEIEVKEARPGNAISVIETDCQVDFEAPKDYVEPQRMPPPPPPQAPAAAEPAGPSAAAEEEEEEDTGPKFVPFVGSGRRLDGRPAASGSAPSTSQQAGSSSNGGPAGTSASASAQRRSGGGTTPTAAAGAAAKPTAAAGGSRKAGTFVSTGNRLLDKLQREQQQQGGAPPSPAAAPPAEEEQKDQQEASFKAFQGKPNRLK